MGFERQFNSYEIKNEVVYGTTLNGKYKFCFDKKYYDLVSQYCWHRHPDGYFRTRIGVNQNGKTEYKLLHVLIMESETGYVYDKKHEIDHIDGDPSNNCVTNLRIISHGLNMKNVKTYVNSSTGYKGIHFSKLEQKYKVYISCDGQRINLGTYADINEAKRVRDQAEEKYFGQYKRNKRE